jgi:hypothetical protein
MNDHETAANARIGRRRFLRVGAGVAGALLLGALFTACGAPASQAPTTAVKAYLITARYNFEKWKGLTDAEYKSAEEAAEGLFPEHGEGSEASPPPLLPQIQGYTPLPQLTGVLEVRSFNSDVFTKLPDGYPGWSRAAKTTFQTSIYANETQRPKPPVGWMAVVDADNIAPFLGRMGDQGGFL